jgi:hypothetical protein
MNLTHPEWMRYAEVFQRHLRAYVPDPMDSESIQQLVDLLWRQGPGSYQRTMRRSDTLGAATSSLSLIECIYERIERAARTEFLIAEHSAQDGGAGGGTDPGPDSSAGGGAWSE